MRLSNAVHASAPWRIHEVVPDFRLEDVWALPVHGGAEDFQALVRIMTSGDDLIGSASLPARILWQLRDRLGHWFDLGRTSPPVRSGSAETAGQLPIPGTNETSLAERLLDDLRKTVTDVQFQSMPFKPLYGTDTEFAAEISNRAVHAVMHLGWTGQDNSRYQGQMAIYVKPRGLLGKGYMAFIKPFRYWIVYPALLQQIEQAWSKQEGK